jgi:hypothetical protein
MATGFHHIHASAPVAKTGSLSPAVARAKIIRDRARSCEQSADPINMNLGESRKYKALPRASGSNGSSAEDSRPQILAKLEANNEVVIVQCINDVIGGHEDPGLSSSSSYYSTSALSPVPVIR